MGAGSIIHCVAPDAVNPGKFFAHKNARPVKILYLDQNKWVELAQGQKSATEFPAQREVLSFLVEEANAGRLVVPLTATNLYETQKINIQERREHLAWVQSTLSQGLVFRGRYKRLEVEIIDHLRAGSGLEPFGPHGPTSMLGNPRSYVGQWPTTERKPGRRPGSRKDEYHSFGRNYW